MGTQQNRGESEGSGTVTESYLDRLNGIMSRVFAATQVQIDNMPEGEKVSIKELTETVAQFLKMPQAQVAQFVAMFVRTSDKCTVQKGRNGGIYRGFVPKKSDHEHRCSACGQKLRKRSENSEGSVDASSGKTPSGPEAKAA